jgi:hypothetical protein
VCSTCLLWRASWFVHLSNVCCRCANYEVINYADLSSPLWPKYKSKLKYEMLQELAYGLQIVHSLYEVCSATCKSIFNGKVHGPCVRETVNTQDWMKASRLECRDAVSYTSVCSNRSCKLFWRSSYSLLPVIYVRVLGDLKWQLLQPPFSCPRP